MYNLIFAVIGNNYNFNAHKGCKCGARLLFKVKKEGSSWCSTV